MKTIILNFLIIAAIAITSSCMGKGRPQQGQQEDWQQAEAEQPQGRQRRAVFAEQPKTVHAYAPEMNNMEMLRMTKQPGWQLLAGTQWVSHKYTNTIKGVNDDLNASFISDGARGFVQSQMGTSGTTDGNTVYLNVMSAVDYLDYVFRRQFSNVKGVTRTKVKTLDMYSENERRQAEEARVTMYNAAVQFNRQAPGGQYTQVRAQTADRANVEYKWVDGKDTIVHIMETFILATYQETRSPYMNMSSVIWTQEWLGTITVPVKNRKKVEDDLNRMASTIQWNEQYIAALNSVTMAGMQRQAAQSQRIVNEMAQAEIRHQQRMAQIVNETNTYIANVHRDVNANRQAAMSRVNQGWRDAIVGVDRFMGADGKVVEVPVSMGSKVWQSADAGTILTSDSYLFQPVDYLYDKNGNLQEFRQLQLMK